MRADRLQIGRLDKGQARRAGQLTSKPTWFNILGCLPTSAFFLLRTARNGPYERNRTKAGDEARSSTRGAFRMMFAPSSECG